MHHTPAPAAGITVRRLLQRCCSSLAAAALLTLAACGGGDGSPAPNVTAAGGTVVSDDGKARLVVPAGAVSADAFIRIERSEPDVATAAHPMYVAGSSYRIVGELGALALPATWELTLDGALAAAERSRPLSVTSVVGSSAYSCNGSDGKPIGNEWVSGSSCPSGCNFVDRLTAGEGSFTLCRPSTSDYHWDTSFPFCDGTPMPGRVYVSVPRDEFPDLYDKLFTLFGPGGLCRSQTPPSTPVLVANLASLVSVTPCTISALKLSCGLPQVGPGVVNALADTTPPSAAFFNALDPQGSAGPRTVTLDLAGSGSLRYVVTGADARQAKSAELWEVLITTAPGSSGPQPGFTTVKRADLTDVHPDPKIFASSAQPPATLPFNATDPLDRYFFARVIDASGNSTDSSIVRVTRVTPTVEVASFGASPATLPPPSGTVTLSWSVANALALSIDHGIGDVTAQTVNGTGSIQVSVDSTRTFTLTATGPNGTTATKTATVTVSADTTAPVVTLAASPGTVVAPGSTVLTATATDNVGATQVEFFRGTTLIGTDTTPGDGFTQAVNFTIADQGSASFTARASDAAGNLGTSNAASVLVTVPQSADRWASPTGSDANPGTQAQPYRTLTKAFANVGSNGTVWLDNGTYTWAAEATAGATQFDWKMRAFPAGRSLRALNSGQAQVNFGLSFTGDATVAGIRFATVVNDGPGNGGGVITVLGSAVVGSAIQLKGVSFGPVTPGSTGGNEAVMLNQCPSCTVVLDTNGSPTFNYLASDFQLIGGGAIISNFGGTFAVNGGSFDAPTLATGSSGCNSSPSNVLFKGGNAALQGVTITLPESASTSSVFCVYGNLSLGNTSIALQGAGRQRLFEVHGHLTLNGSTITAPPSGQLIGLFSPGARITATNSTLDGGSQAIGRNVFGSTDVTSRVTLNGSTVRNVQGNAIEFTGGVTVELTSSVLQANVGDAISLTGTADTRLTMRNSSVSGNAQTQGTGAIVLGGGAGSVFDLGTASAPGGNTILGVSGTRPGLRVGVATGVTVNAVGNTWVASVQGASGNGTYTGNLLVTGGSGQNYVVTSGGLRLAQ